MHSLQISATAMPAALRPWGSAAAAASAAAFLAAPAISTPVTSRERSQTRPAVSKTSPSWVRRSWSAEPSTSAAEPETASRAWAGPPRQAIARARTRSPTYSAGSWPRGGIRPLVISRIEERPPTRSAIAPTAWGSDFEGIARQIRSRPSSSISEAWRTSIESGRGTSGR